MTQFRMSAAMRMKIGDLSVGNARGWGGLGRAFTRALASRSNQPASCYSFFIILLCYYSYFFVMMLSYFFLSLF